jgi:Flp pilus assembly protein TadB
MSMVPDKPIMAKQTYAASMSYVGSARRITAWVRKTGNTTATAVAAWVAASFAILAMWAVVTAWYIVVLGFFGIFTFPYRLIRRGQRKQLHVQKQQLATMQAMMIQQQQALAQTHSQE